MPRQLVGRHRTPGSHPLNRLASLVSQSAKPAAKVSAVVIASGGMLASFALPATAAPLARESGSARATTLASAVAMAVVAPAHAPKTSFGAIDFSAKAVSRKATPAVKIALVHPTPAAAPRTSRSGGRSGGRSAVSRSSSSSVRIPAATGGITAIAASLLGIPYRYGGSTPSGFDCSGFTSYVYRQVGKSIPRTSEGQRSASARVTNPVPGDLVFFGIPATHVGIYAGPGMMYHSPHTGDVSKLASIYSSNVTYGRF